jgi:hypothetical protein
LGGDQTVPGESLPRHQIAHSVLGAGDLLQSLAIFSLARVRVLPLALVLSKAVWLELSQLGSRIKIRKPNRKSKI